jgi:hypothetical protein
MIEVSNCVVCEGPIRRIKRALVAPFLATRIWNRKPFRVDLVRCDSCGFMFYNPRLNGSDLQRLYLDYRSNEYQRSRHASEIWYTKKFNYDLASPESYEGRRATLAQTLKPHIGGQKIERILDYGGDRGDLVAGLFDGAQAFVYDISGVSPAAGVTTVSDPAACKADLIVNSNVLEHVGFPRELVREICAASPAGGLVYLEVPCELPVGAKRIVRRLAQVGIMAVTRPWLSASVLRPASLYMMHEHINYFTPQTLVTLMRSCGGDVVASGSYPSSSRSGSAMVAWCLGTKNRGAK